MTTELGLAIKAARTLKGLRQRQVAELLNVTRAAVGQWEAGTNQPSSSNLVKLSRLLNLDLKFAASYVDLIGAIFNTTIEGVEAKQAVERESISITHLAGGERGIVFPLGDVMGRMQIRYLDIFSSMPDVYGMMLTGSTLEPRYEKGDCVYVNPHAEPRRGEYGIFEVPINQASSKTHQVVRRLVYKDKARIILAQFRPERHDEFAREEVTMMRRIIPELELIQLRGN